MRRDLTDDALAGFFRSLAAPRKVLIFANSRRECEQLGELLSRHKAFDGRVFVHHSSLDRALRLDVEAQLRKPERAICVATSTLELGIDIGDVDLVVLCGPPADWRSFSQRLGRGNRRSDTVDVLCLVPPWSRQPVWDAAVFSVLVAQLEGVAQVEADDGELYGATAQQLVSHLRSGAEWVSRRDFCDVLGDSVEPVVDDIAAALVDEGIIQRHPVHARWGMAQGFEDVERRMEAWSNFPANASKLTLLFRDRPQGEVPFGNITRLTVGASFAFKGATWKVTRVHRDKVHIAPASGSPKVKLIFASLGARMDPALVELIPSALSKALVKMPSNHATTEWWGQVQDHLGPAASGGLTAWSGRGGHTYATFAGKVMNEALLLLLGVRGTTTDATVSSPTPLDFASLPTDLDCWLNAVADVLDTPDELTSWQQRLPPELLAAELRGPYRTHPVFARTVQRLAGAVPTMLADDRLDALIPDGWASSK